MQQQPMSSLMAAVLRNVDNGAKGITNPASWPVSATLGVEYRVHDKQFPNVRHEPNTVYFDDQVQLDKWLVEKREWIKGTDYDFTMNYVVYEWDLGPNVKYADSM